MSLSSPPGTPSGTSISGSVPGTPTSAQQSLQYKQTMIDTWTIQEKQHLAAVVAQSEAATNWVSVSRQMRQYTEANLDHFGGVARPSDWYSQKNCALQYNKLQEVVPPKRKRGGSESSRGASASGSDRGGSSSRREPQQSDQDIIAQKMVEQRIKEIQKKLKVLMPHMNMVEEQFNELTDESKELPDERLDEIERDAEQEDEEERQEKRKLEEEMEERERKMKQLKTLLKPIRVGVSNPSTPSSSAVTSPVPAGDSTAPSPLVSAANTPVKSAPISATASPTKEDKKAEVEATTGDDKENPDKSPLLTAMLQKENNGKDETSATETTPKRTDKTMSDVLKSKFDYTDDEEEPASAIGKKTSSATISGDSPSKLADSGDKRSSNLCKDSESTSSTIKKEDESDDVGVDVVKEPSSDKDKDVKSKEDDVKEEKASEDEPTSGRRSSRQSTSGSGSRAARSSAKKEEPDSAPDSGNPSLPPPSTTTLSRNKTRDRTTSERSDDSSTHGDGEETGGTTTRTRGSRSSKKEEAADTEQQEMTPSAPENRRISRLRGSESDSLSGARGRRGSGTTSPRSSSPPTTNEEAEDSEVELQPQMSSGSRLGGRSGLTRTSTSIAAADSGPSSPAASASTDDATMPAPGSSKGEVLTPVDPKVFASQTNIMLRDMRDLQHAHRFHPNAKDTREDVVKGRVSSLKTISELVGNGTLKNIHEFQRDVATVFLSAAMSHDRDTEAYRLTQEMWRGCNKIVMEYRTTMAQMTVPGAAPSSSSSTASSTYGLRASAGGRGSRRSAAAAAAAAAEAKGTKRTASGAAGETPPAASSAKGRKR